MDLLGTRFSFLKKLPHHLHSAGQLGSTLLVREEKQVENAGKSHGPPHHEKL